MHIQLRPAAAAHAAVDRVDANANSAKLGANRVRTHRENAVTVSGSK